MGCFLERGTSPPYGPLYMYIWTRPFYRESRFFSNLVRVVATAREREGGRERERERERETRRGKRKKKGLEPRKYVC